MLAHAPALVANVLEVVSAAEAPLIFALDTGGREPVGALPTVTLAPHGTHAIDLVVPRARLRGPAVGTLFVRKVNDEDVPVGFFVLFDDVPLAGVIAVPTRVDGQHVDTGLAFDDPLRELPTGTAR